MPQPALRGVRGRTYVLVASTMPGPRSPRRAAIPEYLLTGVLFVGVSSSFPIARSLSGSFCAFPALPAVRSSPKVTDVVCLQHRDKVKIFDNKTRRPGQRAPCPRNFRLGLLHTRPCAVGTHATTMAAAPLGT